MDMKYGPNATRYAYLYSICNLFCPHLCFILFLFSIDMTCRPMQNYEPREQRKIEIGQFKAQSTQFSHFVSPLGYWPQNYIFE